MGLCEVLNIKSSTIVSAKRDVLLRTHISLEKCRGQCYDGASNMLRKKSGAAKQILNIQPKGYVTHCHCHSLSPAVKETTKESNLLSDTMYATTEIAILVKFSSKREQMLDLIKHISLEDDESIDKSKVNQISKLCNARWTVRANCFQRIIDNYQYMYSLWNKFLKETGVTEGVKSRIIGRKGQMTTLELYFVLKLGKLLYSHTDKLSQTYKVRKLQL